MIQSADKSIEERIEELPSVTCDDCIWHVCNYNKVDWDGENDYISRQAVLSILNSFDVMDGYTDQQTAIRLVEQLPSAEPQWIPVSEKLPEKDGRYLVVYWLMKDYMWTDIAWFGNAIMPNRPMQGRYFYISGDGVDVVWDSVLAWMPLPEPYEGGADDDRA